MSFFCKHNWTMLSETITKSELEVAAELAQKVSGVSGRASLARKHIQVFACSKCGEFKRFVEEI